MTQTTRLERRAPQVFACCDFAPIGGNPSVLVGVSPFTYCWTPSTGTDISTAGNFETPRDGTITPENTDADEGGRAGRDLAPMVAEILDVA